MRPAVLLTGSAAVHRSLPTPYRSAGGTSVRGGLGRLREPWMTGIRVNRIRVNLVRVAVIGVDVVRGSEVLVVVRVSRLRVRLAGLFDALVRHSLVLLVLVRGVRCPAVFDRRGGGFRSRWRLPP